MPDLNQNAALQPTHAETEGPRPVAWTNAYYIGSIMEGESIVEAALWNSPAEDGSRVPLYDHAAIEALRAEKDSAQSMVQAWEHVFGTIEAHIRDRINMRDPADPETYLRIIRGDVENIKRASEQICAARWADYARHEAQVSTLTRQLEEAREALKPFAKAADVKLCGEWRDDQHFGQTDVGFHLTFGDLRRAKEVSHG